MKKIVSCVVIIISIFVFCSQDSFAFFGWGKKKESAPAKTKQEQTQQVEKKQAVKKKSKKDEKKEEEKKAAVKTRSDEAIKKAERIRALRQKKRKQLNGRTWKIELSSMPTKEKREEDVLVFKNNQFYSEKFSEQGFSPTNYSLNVKDNDVTVWETMQREEKGQVIFWRGEVTPNMKEMSGVLSWRISEEKAKDYSFTSK